MKNDLAKELYKFYRSGFRKIRNNGQSRSARHWPWIRAAQRMQVQM